MALPSPSQRGFTVTRIGYYLNSRHRWNILLAIANCALGVSASITLLLQQKTVLQYSTCVIGQGWTSHLSWWIWGFFIFFGIKKILKFLAPFVVPKVKLFPQMERRGTFPPITLAWPKLFRPSTKSPSDQVSGQRPGNKPRKTDGGREAQSRLMEAPRIWPTLAAK